MVVGWEIGVLIYIMKKKQRDLEQKKKNMVEGKGGSKSDGNGKNKEAIATVIFKKDSNGKKKRAMVILVYGRRKRRWGGIKKRWQR